MRQTLGDQIQGTMVRARELQQQRAAASVIARRYGAVRSIASWAVFVARSDEIQPYKLLYVIADRGVSC